MHEDRRPGWYPDPRVGGRFRLWDDEGWHGVTSSEPVWGKVTPTGPGASRPRWTSGRFLIAAVAVVAVVVLAWLIGARSSNGAGDTTSTRPDSSEAAAGVDPDRADADGAGTADGSTDGSAGKGAGSDRGAGDGNGDRNGNGGGNGTSEDPSGTGPGSAGPDDPTAGGGDEPDDGGTPGPTDSIPLVSVPPESSCAITDAEFSAVLDTPEIRRVVGDERFGDVRCINNLVAARTSSGLIAVVRQDPSGWTLATLGDDSPCLELELPPDITSALRC